MRRASGRCCVAIAVAVAVAVLGAPWAALPARAQNAGAAVWSGAIRCGPIPGISTLPLHEALQVVVTNGQASYRREVHKTDSSASGGFYEQGVGAVGADGSLTLRGGAVGRGTQMQAVYQGVLPPQGGRARLTGTQQWFTRRTGMVSRDCEISLRR